MYASSSFTTYVVCAVVTCPVTVFCLLVFVFDGFTCPLLSSAGVHGGDSMLVLPSGESDSGTGSLCAFAFGVRKLFRLRLFNVLLLSPEQLFCRLPNRAYVTVILIIASWTVAWYLLCISRRWCNKLTHEPARNTSQTAARAHVPRTYVPRYMFPGTDVPRTYVPRYLCSPIYCKCVVGPMHVGVVITQNVTNGPQNVTFPLT